MRLMSLTFIPPFAALLFSRQKIHIVIGLKLAMTKPKIRRNMAVDGGVCEKNGYIKHEQKKLEILTACGSSIWVVFGGEIDFFSFR